MISDSDRSEGRALLEAATPGPWFAQTEGNASIEELADLIARDLAKNPLNTDAAYVLTADRALNVALTGNGPKGSDNAALIVWLRNHADELLGQREDASLDTRQSREERYRRVTESAERDVAAWPEWKREARR